MQNKGAVKTKECRVQCISYRSVHVRRLLHSPSFCRQSGYCSEMSPNKGGGAQGLYSVDVAARWTSVVPVHQCAMLRGRA